MCSNKNIEKHNSLLGRDAQGKLEHRVQAVTEAELLMYVCLELGRGRQATARLSDLFEKPLPVPLDKVGTRIHE